MPSEEYRPKSPDLSGFVPPSLTRLPSYSQTPTEASSFQGRNSYDASPYFTSQNSQGTNYFGPQPHSQNSAGFSPTLTRTPSIPAVPYQLNQRYSISPPQQRQPPPAFSTPIYPSQSFSQGLVFDSPITTQAPEMPRTRAKRRADDEDENFDPNGAPSQLPTQPVPFTSSLPSVQAPASGEDPALTIDIKTQFPVARIKRIMQADEDVGKVAQATPTAVAKALELFMITLVLKGASAAKSQNSKRVTAQHLKSALMADDKFDFLAECCTDVPDEDKGGTKKGRAKSEADDSDKEMPSVPAKKRKASKRKGSKGSESSD